MSEATPIYLRDVAHALERHLNSPAIAEKHETAIHWVRVEGEDPVAKLPTVSKLAAFFEDASIVACLQHGRSEGSLITVCAQTDPYDRGSLEPLLLVKTLNGLLKAGLEAALIVQWFEQGMPGVEEMRRSRVDAAA